MLHVRSGNSFLTLKVALAVLVTSVLPTANAQDCFIDNRGVERCRLSTGARIGIAVGIFVLISILIFLGGMARRRRIARANQQFVVAHQQQANQYGNSPYGNTGGPYQYGNAPYDPTNAGAQSQYQQQYPPYGQGQYQQGHQGSYGPPQGPPPGIQAPPQYSGYNPPRSPPPAKV